MVLIAQDAGHNFPDINNMKNILLSKGVGRVVFTGPVPHWKPNLPNIIARSLFKDKTTRSFIGVNLDQIESNSLLKLKFINTNELVYIDLIDFFCNTEGCLTRLGENMQTQITTWDNSHLTPFASDYLAKKLLVPIIINKSKFDK